MTGTNLFRNTPARIFPVIKSRVIPRWLEKSEFYPLFLYSVMMTASQRSLGSLPCSQQQKRSPWSLLYNAGPPSFQSSSWIPSTPATLPLLNFSMDSVISFAEGSSFNSVLNGCWRMQRTGEPRTTRPVLIYIYIYIAFYE